MNQIKQSIIDFKELDIFINELEDKKGALIAVLHKAQELYGYLPNKVQFHISKKLGIPNSKVFGVVTFYSFFTTKPKGKFDINVCLGTACYVRGSEKILKEFEKQLKISIGQMTKDGFFSLSSLRCVGACGLAPVVMVNDKVYGRVKPEDVNEIINEYSLKDGKKNE